MMLYSIMLDSIMLQRLRLDGSADRRSTRHADDVRRPGVYIAQPGGANPAYVQELGCVYLNGARYNVQPIIGGWAKRFSYGGLSTYPPIAADYFDPGAQDLMVN